MTVNEELYATELMETFDNFKESNRDYAKYILQALKIDKESITNILK